MTAGRRPRVYVTARRGAGSMPAYRLYLDAIREAGGDPVLVTPESGLSTGEILRDADAIVFAGGVDPDPALYGEEVGTGFAIPVEIDRERDDLEIPLAREAVEADLPVLGICRGAQVLNVAHGGSLHQDLSQAGMDSAAHHQSRWEPRPDDAAGSHPLRLDPCSRLAAILGEGAVAVNTFHHQAVEEVAPGFRVVARSADGMIEAIERQDRTFVVGVQWHPERMARGDPRQAAIFRRLVEAARAR